MAIPWAQEAWKEVTGTTIKNCFEKCGIIKNDDLMEIEEEDLEFEALVQELCPDVSATEYVNFDVDIPASEPLINEHKIDWRQKSREDCINAVLNENNIAQEISDDDNDDDEEVDEIEDETLSFNEWLKLLDKINKCFFLDEKSHKMFSTATKKSENLQRQNRNQNSTTSYFSWFQSTKISMLLTFDFCVEVVALYLLKTFFITLTCPCFTLWNPLTWKTHSWFILAKYSFLYGISIKRTSL